MTRWFTSLGLNSKLALLAVVLGAVAVFARPMRGAVVNVNPSELAAIVGGELDHVAVEQLADWIIAGRTDYRLLDLRDGAAYGTYHIPTAESVPIVSLPDYPVGRQERVILYSDGGIHAAQGWFLLRARGYGGVYILSGGLDEWKDRVLFPTRTADVSPEQVKAWEKASRVAQHFGGRPRSGVAADTASAPVELPKMASPGATAAAKPAKKKREGC